MTSGRVLVYNYADSQLNYGRDKDMMKCLSGAILAIAALTTSAATWNVSMTDPDARADAVLPLKP